MTHVPVKKASRTTGWFLFPILVLTLSSCDPGQVLIIENKTVDKANIRFVFNKGSEYYGFGEPLDSDTLTVELDSTASNSVKLYHFGIGTWEIQSSLDSLASAVKYIELETWKSKQTYAGAAQIRNFFESRVAGRHKEVIEIRLE